MRSFRWASLFCALLLTLSACEDGGSTGKSDGTGGDAGTADVDGGGVQGFVSAKSRAGCDKLEDGYVCVTGRVENVDKERSEVAISVVGQPEAKGAIDERGDFAVKVNERRSPVTTSKAEAMPKGSSDKSDVPYTVVLERKKSRDGRAQRVQFKPAVVEGQTPSERTEDVGALTLLPNGSITGVVTLAGRSDHTGIRVFLPGTSFMATTDATGKFTMTDVPPGLFPFLRADSDGYNPALVAEVDVPSAAALTLSPIELTLSTGSEGSFEFIGVSRDALGAFSTSTTVGLAIEANDSAVLMMLSENGTFEGAKWQPLETPTSFTFAGEGERKLYLKLADQNGLESAPSTRTLTISNNPQVSSLNPSGTTNASRPTLTWAASRVENARHHIQLATTATFESPLVDEKGIAGTTYPLTTNLISGTTYYFRVAIERGSEQWGWSSPVAFLFDLGTVAVLSPSGSTDDSLPVLDWGDSVLSGATYHVQVASDAAFNDLVEQAQGLTSSSYKMTKRLTQGQTYYARVGIVDALGAAGAFSAASAFLFSLGTASLTTPANDGLTNDKTPTFVWTPVSKAQSYTLRYATSSDLSSATVINGLLDANYTLPSALADTNSTRYYWQVTPVDANGAVGPSSATHSFTLDTVGPSGSLVINDGDGSTHDETVSVAVSAADASGVVDMALARTAPNPTSLTWSPYSSEDVNLTYTELASSNTGTITAYGYVRDAAGNVSALLSDSIDLERTLVTGSTITSNTSWTLAASPYILSGTLTILNPATLTIEAGVTVYFRPGAKIDVRNGGAAGESGLSAVGTAQAPISLVGGNVEIRYATDWTNGGGGNTYDGGGAYVKGPRFEHVDMSDGVIAMVTGSANEVPGFYMKSSEVGKITSNGFARIVGAFIDHSAFTVPDVEYLNLASSRLLHSYVDRLWLSGTNCVSTEITHNKISYLYIDGGIPASTNISYNVISEHVIWRPVIFGATGAMRNNNFDGSVPTTLKVNGGAGDGGDVADYKNNYWGAAATLEMAKSVDPVNVTSIYDNFDDSTLPTIDYSGYLTNPVVGAGPDW